MKYKFYYKPHNIYSQNFTKVLNTLKYSNILFIANVEDLFNKFYIGKNGPIVENIEKVKYNLEHRLNEKCDNAYPVENKDNKVAHKELTDRKQDRNKTEFDENPIE